MVRHHGLIFAILLFSGVALADGPQKGRVQARDAELDRLAREVNAAMDAGHQAQARDLLFGMWELDRSAKAACNIGQLSHRLGDAVLAVEWLTICLRLQPKPRTERERMLDEARRADLAIAKRRVGSLAVYTNRPNAAVFIAGRKVQIGEPVFVKPGKVTVWAQDGTRIDRSDIEVTPGDERSVLLTFSDPPAQLPTLRPSLPTLVRPQLPTLSTPRATAHNASNSAYPVVIAAGATLTTIGVLTGVAAQISARNAYENANFATDRAGGEIVCAQNSRLPDCREANDSIADSVEFNRIGIASLAIAGTVAAGTVIYAVLARKPIPAAVPTVVIQW
jgi:hypothetical protein